MFTCVKKKQSLEIHSKINKYPSVFHIHLLLFVIHLHRQRHYIVAVAVNRQWRHQRGDGGGFRNKHRHCLFIGVLWAPCSSAQACEAAVSSFVPTLAVAAPVASLFVGIGIVAPVVGARAAFELALASKNVSHSPPPTLPTRKQQQPKYVSLQLEAQRAHGLRV